MVSGVFISLLKALACLDAERKTLKGQEGQIRHLPWPDPREMGGGTALDQRRMGLSQTQEESQRGGEEAREAAKASHLCAIWRLFSFAVC